MALVLGMLRTMFSKLQAKLAETQTRVEVLVAQHRRHRTGAKRLRTPSGSALTTSTKLSRLRSAVMAQSEMTAVEEVALAVSDTETLEDRFYTMEQHDAIEALLQGLKAKSSRLES